MLFAAVILALVVLVWAVIDRAWQTLLLALAILLVALAQQNPGWHW